jgi:hypothetical protein
MDEVGRTCITHGRNDKYKIYPFIKLKNGDHFVDLDIDGN